VPRQFFQRSPEIHREFGQTHRLNLKSRFREEMSCFLIAFFLLLMAGTLIFLVLRRGLGLQLAVRLAQLLSMVDSFLMALLQQVLQLLHLETQFSQLLLVRRARL